MGALHTPDVCDCSLAQHTSDETRPGRRTRPAPAHTPSRLAQGSDSTTEVLGRVPESTGESILDGTGNSSALPPSSIPLLPSDTLPGPYVCASGCVDGEYRWLDVASSPPDRQPRAATSCVGRDERCLGSRQPHNRQAPERCVQAIEQALGSSHPLNGCVTCPRHTQPATDSPTQYEGMADLQAALREKRTSPQP